MASEKTLKAILKGTGNLKRTLDGISDSAGDVGDSLSGAASSAETASKAFDSAEDEGDDLRDTLSGIVDESGAVDGALESVQSSTDEVADEMSSADRETEGYTRSLEKNTTAIAGNIAAQEALQSSVDESGDEAAQSSRRFGRYNTVLASTGATSVLSSMVDGDNALDVDSESSGIVGTIKRTLGFETQIRSTPDLSPDTETKDIVPELAGLHALSRSMPDDLESPTITPEVDTDTSERRVSSLTASLMGLAGMTLPTSGFEGLGDTIEDDTDRSRGLIASLQGIVATAVSMPEIREHLPDDLSLPVDLDIDRSPLSRLRRGVTVPVRFVRGKIPSIGFPDLGEDRGGLRLPDFDLPDLGDGRGLGLPDIDLPNLSGFKRTISSVGRSAGKSLGPVREFLKGISQFTGMGNEIMGLKTISGVLGEIGGMGSATSVLTGVAGAVSAFAGIGVLIAGLVDLAAAVGGVVTAFVGLGSVLAGIVGVGLFQKGQEIVNNSKEVETAWQGAAQYIKSFGDDAKRALQPIFDLDTGGFLEGFLRGGLNWLRDFSVMTSRLFPDISGMFDRLGGVWDETEPEFFAALEDNIRAFLPMIEGFIGWFLKKTPGAIRYMTAMGTKLLPKLARMFGSIGGAIKPFLPAGAAFVSILADLITFLAEVITPVSEIVGFALTPVLQAIAAVMGALADVTKWASDALSGFMDNLNRWVGAIWEATKSLDAKLLAGLLNNAVAAIFEGITNGFLWAIETFYGVAIDAIQALPGGRKALKSIGVPDQLDLPEVDLSGMKVDLYPDKPGKQTSPIPPTEQGTDTYENNNPEITINNYGDMGEGGPQWRRAVKRAYKEAQREEHLRKTNLRS